jgi:hypothetical protein
MQGDMSKVMRLDPSTAEAVAHVHVSAGTWLAAAGCELWTASVDGTIRQIAMP